MNYLLIGKYIFLSKLTDPEYAKGKVNELLKDNHMKHSYKADNVI